MSYFEKNYYKDDIEYLEDWFCIIDLLLEKKHIKDMKYSSYNKKKLKNIESKINKKKKEIERKKINSLKRRKNDFSLDNIVKKYKLSDTEKRIILFLLYKYFEVDNINITGKLILESVTENRLHLMKSQKYLKENSPLIKNKIVEIVLKNNNNILKSEFKLSEKFISILLGENESFKQQKEDYIISNKKDYKSYLNLHFKLIQLMEKRAEIRFSLREKDILGFGKIRKEKSELRYIQYQIRKTENLIRSFGEMREDFPIERLVKEYNLNYDEKLILIILLKDSLGLTDDFVGYEGKRILSIISKTEEELFIKRALLYRNSNLIKNKLIKLERLWDEQNILEGEFYLAEGVIRKILGDVEKDDDEDEKSFGITEEDGESELNKNSKLLIEIEPRFSFEEVILNKEKKKLIEIALSQQINHELIFKKWGFGKKIPYGNALTMLFSGPPGTGKTMTAEAIAKRLNKKLLIANYSQIQNLYVGETEKRIVKVFKEAKEKEGVLLWDEADAMFYSRDIANHSWEQRDINIILQEIEKFEGIVILTTNRKIALDKALERRISLKITFEMPNEEERELIWKSLLPKEVPLAKDINFKFLAKKYEVSGGIIKNAILNSARYAAYKNASCITMEDLIYGIELEIENMTEHNKKIGFY